MTRYTNRHQTRHRCSRRSPSPPYRRCARNEDHGSALIGALLAMALLTVVAVTCWRGFRSLEVSLISKAVIEVLDGGRIRAQLLGQTVTAWCVPGTGTILWSAGGISPSDPGGSGRTAYIAPGHGALLACRFGAIGSKGSASGTTPPGNLISFYPDGSVSAGEIVVIGNHAQCVITQSVLGAHRLECPSFGI